jgi:hypothetical protein
MPQPRAFADLARLLAAADARLRRLAGGTPVRCWPHHFDLAALLVERRGPGGEASATVGVGLAVPDAIEPSGYWYVSPWSGSEPARPAAWPALARGRWIARGGPLRMAVLPLADVAAIEDAPARSRTVEAFFAAALAASRRAL